MNLEERLAQIEAAAAQPGGLILRAVMRATEGQPDLLRSLEAAAVPHWWDVSTLALLLDPDLAPEAPRWTERLCALSFAEPFLAVPGAFNIHEVARLALRGKLHSEGRLPALSARALRTLDQPVGETATDRTIERLYHQLLAEPEAGAEALEAAWRDWDDQGRWATLLDLAGMLEEVLPHLIGAGRARSLLRRADIRRERCLLSKVKDEAKESLLLFQHLGNERAQGQALNFLGDLAVDQGNRPEAQLLFGEALNIRKRLAASDPGNAAWQRDLSVSLDRLGDLAVALEDLSEAQRCFAEAMNIREHLAEFDLGNAAWQRDFSVSLEKLGKLALAQGNRPEAQRRFTEALRIRERLVESDPSNATWQRSLSVSLEKLGDLAVAQGNHFEAHRCFAEGLTIRERLVASDPGNALWQRDLSVSLNKLGNLAVVQGNRSEAQHLFSKALSIRERLVASDPGNVAWQRDLSVSLNKLGDLAVAQGDLSEAQRCFAQALDIIKRLAALDSKNAAP